MFVVVYDLFHICKQSCVCVCFRFKSNCMLAVVLHFATLQRCVVYDVSDVCILSLSC